MAIVLIILATTLILSIVILSLVSKVIKKAEDEFYEYQREYEDKY